MKYSVVYGSLLMHNIYMIDQDLRRMRVLVGKINSLEVYVSEEEGGRIKE